MSSFIVSLPVVVIIVVVVISSILVSITRHPKLLLHIMKTARLLHTALLRHRLQALKPIKPIIRIIPSAKPRQQIAQHVLTIPKSIRTKPVILKPAQRPQSTQTVRPHRVHP